MFHRKPQSQSLEQARVARRQAERQLVLALGPLHNSLAEYYTYAPLPDGHNAELKVVRPKAAVTTSTSVPAATGTQNGTSAGQPFIVLFHGGGFSGGTVEYMTRPAREFA